MKWYHWLILFLALALCGATPAAVSASGPTPPPVDGIVTLNPPIEWPASLDELYQFIDEGRYGYVWSNPCPADITGPVLYWRDTGRLHAGHDEDALFMAGALAWLRGDLLACKPEGDRVLFYGPALPELFELLKEPNK